MKFKDLRPNDVLRSVNSASNSVLIVVENHLPSGLTVLCFIEGQFRVHDDFACAVPDFDIAPTWKLIR